MSIIKFETHSDDRGELTVIEKCIPFDIKRLFYPKKVPPGEQRGGHAHRLGHQVIIAIEGTFKVQVTKSGSDLATYSLSDPSVGLYIPPLIWIDLFDFSPGAICLVLASNTYDEADHIRDFSEFLILMTPREA